jgi:CheY-like chemotaxis protein
MSDCLDLPKKVLVVEDSWEMRSALKDLFASLGSFDVDYVGGETQATAWVEHHRDWDLAVVDLVLDEGSGFNLVRRFHRQPRPGRIVVLSNFVSPAIIDTCKENGADAVFHKDEADLFANYVELLGRTGRSASAAADSANASSFGGAAAAKRQ